MEHVGPGHRQNLVQIVHRLHLFHHRNHQHVGVDPGCGLVPGNADAVVVGAAPAHPALAVGIVAGGAGHAGSHFAGVDVGNDDTLQAPVQEAQDGGFLVVGDAGDGGDAEGLGGPHHVLHLVQVHRAVFAVNHHEVVADGPENFHQVGGVAGDDGAEYYVAGSQLGLSSVGLHCVASLQVELMGRLYGRQARLAMAAGAG